MTSDGSNFNDFPQNQLTRCRQFKECYKVNRDHTFFCSKQFFPRYFKKISQVIQLYTVTTIE